MTMTNIERCLKENPKSKIHIFRSGGGLRVANFGRFYSESFEFSTMMEQLEEDCRLGGLEYKEKYGENGIFTSYLTGTATATSDLDLHVLRSHNIDMRFKDNVFVVEILDDYFDGVIPDWAWEQANVAAKQGKYDAIQFTDGPCQFEMYPCPSSFGSGVSCTTKVISPKGVTNSMSICLKKVGKSINSLQDAMDNAIIAKWELNHNKKR